MSEEGRHGRYEVNAVGGVKSHENKAVEVTKEGDQSRSITCCRTAGAERKNCRMDDKAAQERQVNNRASSPRKHQREDDVGIAPPYGEDPLARFPAQ